MINKYGNVLMGSFVWPEELTTSTLLRFSTHIHKPGAIEEMAKRLVQFYSEEKRLQLAHLNSMQPSSESERQDVSRLVEICRKGWEAEEKLGSKALLYLHGLFTSVARLGLVPGHEAGFESLGESLTWASLLQWSSVGRPTFRLSEGLAAALALTKVDPANELRMPFESFRILLPKGFFKVMCNNPRDGVDPVEADNILVTTTNVFGKRYLNPSEAPKHIPLESMGKFWAESTHHTAFTVQLLASRQPAGGANVFNWFWCPSPETGVASVLENLDTRTEDDEVGSWNWETDALPGKDEENGTLAVRLALNTIAYINSIRSEALPSSLKDRGTKSMRLEAKCPSRWVLGEEIKLRPELVRAAKEHLSGVSGWRLKTRFIVRGHWRNQACGPARSERRQQWIEPYWKGPATMDEALLRNYSVADSA